MLHEAGPENSYVSRQFGDTAHIVIPPSNAQHPVHPYYRNEKATSMPGQSGTAGSFQPGPVTALYNIVRSRHTDIIGWHVSDDLVVQEVVPESAAALAGLQRGMRVKAVNGVAVHDVVKLRSVIGTQTSMQITVDMPHLYRPQSANERQSAPFRQEQPSRLTPQTVVITDITHPENLRILNHKKATVFEKYANVAVVDVPGLGRHTLPLTNLINLDDTAAHGPIPQQGAAAGSVPAQGGDLVSGIQRRGSSPLQVLETNNYNLAPDVRTLNDVLSSDLPPGLKRIHAVKKPDERLGLGLKEMVLRTVDHDSPADRAGAEQYIHWRLITVNGVKVVKIEDVARVTNGATDVECVFEVPEITVRKHPDEVLGCELQELVIADVVPGSAAERYGLDKWKGFMITHVNGFPVTSVREIKRAYQGADSVRLRLDLEELSVHVGQAKKLGLFLDSMVLTGTSKGSPSKIAGVGKFLGRKLTHVNGRPVYSTGDVEEMMKYPHDGNPDYVAVRFDMPNRGGGQVPQSTLPASAPVTPRAQQLANAGSYLPANHYPAVHPRSPVLQVPPDSDVFQSYVPSLPPPLHHRYNRISVPTSPIATAPNSYGYSSPLKGVGDFGLRAQGSDQVYQGYSVSNVNPVVPPYAMYKTESVMQSFREDQQRRDAKEQAVRLAELEQKVRSLEREKDAEAHLPQWLRARQPATVRAPWETGHPYSRTIPSPVQQKHVSFAVTPPREPAASLQTRALSPPRPNAVACCTCGGRAEVECRDCALLYCRTCCAAAHGGSNRLRATHINMV